MWLGRRTLFYSDYFICVLSQLKAKTTLYDRSQLKAGTTAVCYDNEVS
jgi:hypothetical protein